MKKLIMLTVASVTAFSALGAATPASAYTTKGMGYCKSWVAAVDDRFWILGFVSGVNAATGKDIAKTTDADDIYRFVTAYCKANPSDDLADAASAFVKSH